MCKDNYLFHNEVLLITTQNMNIQILKNKDDTLTALCHFILPTTCKDSEVFKVSENLSFAACFLRHPIFVFVFDATSELAFSTDYSELFDLYMEARLALSEIVKWKECWLEA